MVQPVLEGQTRYGHVGGRLRPAFPFYQKFNSKEKIRKIMQLEKHSTLFLT